MEQGAEKVEEKVEKKRSIFKIVFVIAAVGVYLFSRSSGSGLLPEQLFFASLVYLLSCIPVAIYLRKEEKGIPYVPFFGIIFFVHFGNIFTNFKFIQMANVSSESVTYALQLSALGFLSFLIAFYSKIGKFIEAQTPHLNVTLDPSKCMNLGVILYASSFCLTYFFMSYIVTFIGEAVKAFIGQLSVLAIVIFVLLYLQGKLNFFCKFLLWCIFLPLRFLLILASGTVMPLVLEAATIFFIYFYCRKKIPWVMIFLVSLLIWRVWGVRDEFRALTWFEGSRSRETTFDKARLYVDLILQRASKADRYADTVAYENLSMRLNHLITFVKVVELTPSRIPFWGGYTYQTLPTSFIPRILFPGKPTKTIGTEFGQRYALLNPDDFTTSYNLPILVEMYINFGLVGVAVGMFIFGLLIRALYALINYPGCGDGTFLIGATVFYSLLNVESDFSLVFGSVIQYSLLFYAVMGFMRQSKRQTQQLDGS